MTDLALPLPGAVAGVLAGCVLAPNTRLPPNNNPAALNNPTRMTSRRDSGRLKLMQRASAVGD
jgi:hypothetical protein